MTPPRSPPATIVVGIDVGGTFTDLFFIDESSGRTWTAKVASTRGAEAAGVVNGLAKGGVEATRIATIVHGTTVGTNALLERKGGTAGLITTAGFRDVLEMRRRDRPQTWGLRGSFSPVIPRDRRLEADERTLADGSIRTPVATDEIEARARELIAAGAEAVALVFVNAYANPANEQQAAQALRSVWPNAFVSVSSEILPEIREFERTSTTALNAYLQPVVAAYLDRLRTDLGGQGFTGELLIVQSNGGVMTVADAAARPVRTALSGPAAGVIAAAHIARSAGFPDVITGDVGGTSFDISVIADAGTTLSPQTSIDFGLVIRQPMIEITTIGAGGGSLAHVDAGGLLQIGPQSASAVPGPACYGRGNTRPTVTDANVVLGRINADAPIGGGDRRLDVAAARGAIEEHVAHPLGLHIDAAAEAIIRVANSRMAGAIRLVSIERGHDPRRFMLMPFGGGGGLHAGALVREVGLKGALIPRYPGVTSALGCIIADMRHDFVLTLNRPLDELDVEHLGSEISRLEQTGSQRLNRSGVAFEGRRTIVELDMLYIGQSHAIAVPIAWQQRPPSREEIGHQFEAHYRAAFGRLLDGLPLRVINLRVAVEGLRPKLDLALMAPRSGSLSEARTGIRPVIFSGRRIGAAIYDRAKLPVAAEIRGPAVIEQPDATLLIDPGMTASVDRLGNIILAPAATT